MNPLILNYLQQQMQQGSNPQGGFQAQGGMPADQSQMMMPQQMPMEEMPQEQMQPSQQERRNPFDSGIRKAIEAARESLGMTDKQQDKAMRRGMLAFGANMSQQPKRRGLLANFGSVSQALTPALLEHDAVEDQSLQQNNTLANQILAHQAAEDTRAAQAEDKAWQKQFAREKFDFQKELSNRQLGEQQRHHGLIETAKQEKAKGKESIAEQKEGNVSNVLNVAEKTLQDLGEEGFRGRTTRVIDKFLPGGVYITPEQAEVNTIGNMLKGSLFNYFTYRNQAEFENLPKVSADNPPEVNKAIIAKIKQLIKKQEQEHSSPFKPAGVETSGQVHTSNAMSDQSQNTDHNPSTSSDQEWILMQSPSGQQKEVHFEDVPGLEARGFRRMQ
jgi:hypothetical protein